MLIMTFLIAQGQSHVLKFNLVFQIGIKTNRYDDNSIPVIELSRALLSSCLTLGTIMETCRLKKGNLKILNVQDVKKN